MTVKRIVAPNRWVGVSGDVKPTQATYPRVRAGDTFYEHNTDLMYITYDGTNWVAKASLDTIGVLAAGTDTIGKVNIKRVPVHTYTTGTGTTLANLTPGAAYRLLAIRIHLSSALAAAETLTAILNSGTANIHDVVFFTLDMGTPDIRDVDLDYGDENKFFEAADVIDIALSANTGSDTWGCTTIHELV